MEIVVPILVVVLLGVLFYVKCYKSGPPSKVEKAGELEYAPYDEVTGNVAVAVAAGGRAAPVSSTDAVNVEADKEF